MQAEQIVAGIVVVLLLALLAVSLAGLWKLFEKAGEPGYAAIIPIYNVYVMSEVVDLPSTPLTIVFAISIFIPVIGPLVNSLIQAVLGWKIAKSFGKGDGFALGTAIFPFLFYPIIGFGSAEYKGGA